MQMKGKARRWDLEVGNYVLSSLFLRTAMLIICTLYVHPVFYYILLRYELGMLPVHFMLLRPIIHSCVLLLKRRKMQERGRYTNAIPHR